MKILIPVEKLKQNKAVIRGFWRSDKGFLFYDYLKELDTKEQDYVEAIRKNYKQESVFYTDNSKAFIWNGKDTVILHKFIRYQVPIRKNAKPIIKRLLKLYGGCTVYLYKKSCDIIAWYN